GDLGTVVRRMQSFKRVFPATAIDEIVPFGNQIHDRATGMALAKRHPAIHTARTLSLQLVLGDRLVHLLPIEHTQLDRLALRALTGIFHEPLWITHLLSRTEDSGLRRNALPFTRPSFLSTQ